MRQTKVELEQLLAVGFAQYVESCKNNIALQSTGDAREFLQLLLLEGQKFANREYPGMPFSKFLHQMGRLGARVQIVNEINRQVAKHFNCELVQIQEKAKRKTDNYDETLVDGPGDFSDSLFVDAGAKESDEDIAQEGSEPGERPFPEAEQDHVSDDDL